MPCYELIHLIAEYNAIDTGLMRRQPS